MTSSVTLGSPIQWDEHAVSRATEEFIRGFPSYRTTRSLDDRRAREFSRMDAQGHVYLDWTGAAPYSELLLERHMDLLKRSVLGNPHSFSRAATLSSELMEETADTVLRYFGADEREYRVIFTLNATHACKLVGESFPFAGDSRLLLSRDNHNSVLGIWCFARQREAAVEYVELNAETMTLDGRDLERKLERPGAGPSLFAYPAQSNFSGVKHDLTWVRRARDRGWLTLLDVAAFVPSNCLRLSEVGPDFACLSFYKMLGYPTGVGCLLARVEALRRLERPWFSGGTVAGVSVAAGRYLMASDESALEEGTASYAAIPAVKLGLELLTEADMAAASVRQEALMGWLVSRLGSLQHSNGRQLVRVYGPQGTRERGPAVSFNLLDPEGVRWNVRCVEAAANERGISLRAGAHCNPGACEVALNLDTSMLQELFATADVSRDEFMWRQDDLLVGALRVSLGPVSNFRDVYALISCLEGFVDKTAV